MELIDLTWNVIDWTPSQIDFSLNFTYPVNVSQNDEPDLLMMMLNIHDYTTNSGKYLPINAVLEVFIPRQLDRDTEQLVVTAADVAEKSSNAILGSNVLVNLMLSASLNMIW